MILVKKAKRFDSILSFEKVKEMIKVDEWPGGTCFMVANNYILIGPHLSSKKEKNAP